MSARLRVLCGGIAEVAANRAARSERAVVTLSEAKKLTCGRLHGSWETAGSHSSSASLPESFFW